MTVQLLTVTEDEGEQRLDKWLRRRFPQLNQVAVEMISGTLASARIVMACEELPANSSARCSPPSSNPVTKVST